MHRSALAHMRLCVNLYMRKDRKYRVLDFGSGRVQDETRSHRDLLVDYDCEITGVDISEEEGVDVVMTKPYRVPLKSNSMDVIMTTSVFEHVPFMWVSFLELVRVLKPQGYIFLTAPSRGNVHAFPYDCWRYYPDGMRALAAFAHVELVEVHTDFPPLVNGRHAYEQIERPAYYWGDTVAVFRKRKKYPSIKAGLVREINVRWANAVGDLERTPTPAPVKGRENILRTK